MIHAHPFANNPKGEGMDEATTRDHIQRHAEAVERGDMEAVVADFSEELRPQAPQIAQTLPQPVTRAEVLSVDIGDPVSVATIRYSGGTGSVTIRSDWQDQGGRPVIIHAEPAG
jgi:hypothetical protein